MIDALSPEQVFVVSTVGAVIVWSCILAVFVVAVFQNRRHRRSMESDAQREERMRWRRRKRPLRTVDFDSDRIEMRSLTGRFLSLTMKYDDPVWMGFSEPESKWIVRIGDSQFDGATQREALEKAEAMTG